MKIMVDHLQMIPRYARDSEIIKSYGFKVVLKYEINFTNRRLTPVQSSVQVLGHGVRVAI